VGLNLTWLLTVLGIIVGGASVPVGLILLWKRMSTVAAVAAPWTGLACGLIAWFVTTSKRSGKIDVTTTGDTTNAVAGNITSWGVGFLAAVVLSLIFPAKYVSTNPRDIDRYNKIHGISGTRSEELYPSAHTTPPHPTEEAEKVKEDGKTTPVQNKGQENLKSEPKPETYVPTGNELVDYLETQHMEPMDPVLAKKGERLALGANIVFVAIAMILVPFTLFGTGYIFNRAFFTGYVVVSFIWVWVSMCICVIYPVVESTGALREVSRGLFRDIGVLIGNKKPKTTGSEESKA